MKKSGPFLVLLAFILSTCNLTESTSPRNHVPTCQTHGIVKDFTGLDGCGLLIVKDDGQKLIPLSVVNNFELKAGQEIMFDYVVEPRANICMAGETVNIICIRELNNIACDQNGNFRIATALEYDTLQSVGFTVMDYSYKNDLLSIDIGYSGCSPERVFNLIGSPSIIKTWPPQKEVKLVFDQQPCEAYFRQKICFDVSMIQSQMVFRLEDNTGTVHQIKVGY